MQTHSLQTSSPRRPKKYNTLAAAGAASLLLSGTFVHAGREYGVLDLGVGIPTGINDVGNVVGWNHGNPYCFRTGPYAPINDATDGILNYPGPEATRINNTGLVTGLGNESPYVTDGVTDTD